MEGAKGEIDSVIDNYIEEAQKRLGETENRSRTAHTKNGVEKTEDNEE